MMLRSYVLSSFVELSGFRSRKYESLRRTTDGRRAMTIAYLSLWLRWANNLFQQELTIRKDSTSESDITSNAVLKI